MTSNESRSNSDTNENVTCLKKLSRNGLSSCQEICPAMWCKYPNYVVTSEISDSNLNEIFQRMKTNHRKRHQIISAVCAGSARENYLSLSFLFLWSFLCLSLSHGRGRRWRHWSGWWARAVPFDNVSHSSSRWSVPWLIPRLCFSRTTLLFPGGFLCWLLRTKTLTIFAENIWGLR